MKKSIIATLLLSSIGGAVNAGTMGPVAPVNTFWYAELFSGYSWAQDETLFIGVPTAPQALVYNVDGSVIFGAEVGYRFTDWFKAGVEVSYRPDYLGESYDVAETLGARNIGVTPTKVLTGMVNGYLNAGNYSGFTPYAFAGIGVASRRYGDVNVHNEASLEPVFYQRRDTSSDFAWQAGLGATYDINSNLAIDLRGRWVDFGDDMNSTGVGVFRPQGTDLRFFSTDVNAANFKAIELTVGVIGKLDI